MSPHSKNIASISFWETSEFQISPNLHSRVPERYFVMQTQQPIALVTARAFLRLFPVQERNACRAVVFDEGGR
jgi:hypothetical protein